MRFADGSIPNQENKLSKPQKKYALEKEKEP
jgi:hypothetical protein